MSRGLLYCLKRKRDISIKPIFSGVKTAFRWTPALSEIRLSVLSVGERHRDLSDVIRFSRAIAPDSTVGSP